MTSEVRRLLDERWPRVCEVARTHLATIEAFARSGEGGTPTQRDAAHGAAHKLSGSLGMFGRRDASAVASAIEGVLDVDLPLPVASLSELRLLLSQLDSMISLDRLPAT